LAKYKFTCIYVVEAESKAQAMEKVKHNPTEYLGYESSTLVTERTRVVSGIFCQSLHLPKPPASGHTLDACFLLGAHLLR
jgi:hypothetical protein